MRRAFPLVASAIAVLAVACATDQPRLSSPPEIGPWGVDLAQMDASVAPGDDFYRYVNGLWLANTPIPPDRTNYGSFSVLVDKAEAQLREIIEESTAADAAPGSPEQRIGDLFTSFMDEAAVEAAGLAPIQDGLDQIAAAETHDDIIRVMARPDLQSAGPIGGGVEIDFKDPSRYIFYMSHGGLGLPDRDYYLSDDERFAELRAAYADHIAKMLTLADVADGEAKAQAILELETKIAEAHWERARRRDREATYNLMTVDELIAYAPGFNWRLLFDEAGLAQVNELVAQEKDSFPKLAATFAETPVSTWRDYLTFHVLSAHAPYLSSAFEEEDFNFFGRTLSGQEVQRDRWRRGVTLVDGAIGFDVGKIYVERHFSPEAKAAMQDLVDNLKAALAERIDALGWMTPETKAEAHQKLQSFTTKIGYPDVWEDYEGLEIRPDDLIGNIRRSNAWTWNDNISRLGGPIDRDRWEMTPQTVNAYYNPLLNEIVFPAAILQAPFFDVNADPAVNYGAIGAVIGHEIGHGFDDQGRKSDGTGLLRDWWTPADAEAFEVKAAVLGEQYGSYEAPPGYRLNPEFTMGENIGDLGGVNMALEAYHLSLNGRPAPVLDGYTGDQRFFMAWAQIWRRNYRDQDLINRISTDPHSPSEFRANGVVRNLDAWYEAFGVEPGSALYLDPERRVSIW